MESLDILYIVLAFAALWVTAFTCWFIYQIVTIMRNVNNVISDLHEAISKIEGTMNTIKSRFESHTSNLGIIAEGAKQVVSYVLDKNKKKDSEK